MTPAVEKILAEISTLTPAEREELQELLGSSRPTAELVNKIKGKYSFVATSSEAFAGRKQEEIDLEDRRNGNRR
jgi:hypothetical protein